MIVELQRLRAAVVTAKREALEEAAKVADEAIAFADAHRVDLLLKNRVHRPTAVDIAIAIRALQEKPHG